MIEFKCESCGARVKAPPSLAGKTGKCPKCGTLNRVPPQERPAASEPEAVAESNQPAVSAMAQERDGSTPVGWADSAPAAQPRRQPKSSEPERSAPADANEPASDTGRIASVPPEQGRRHSPPRRSLAPFVWGWVLIVLGIVAFLLSCAVVSHTDSELKRIHDEGLLVAHSLQEASENASKAAADKAAYAADQNEYALHFANQDVIFEAKKKLYALASMPPGYVKDKAELEAQFNVEETERRCRFAEEKMAAQDRVDAAQENLDAVKASIKAAQQDDALSIERDAKMARIAQTGAHITLALRLGAGLCALAGLIILSYWLATGGMRPSGVRLD